MAKTWRLEKKSGENSYRLFLANESTGWRKEIPLKPFKSSRFSYTDGVLEKIIIERVSDVTDCLLSHSDSIMFNEKNDSMFSYFINIEKQIHWVSNKNIIIIFDGHNATVLLNGKLYISSDVYNYTLFFNNAVKIIKDLYPGYW